MSLAPLEDRVLVRPNDAEQETASGIVLPDVAQEKPQIGTVVAVGAGKRNDKGEQIVPDVAVGDEILFSRYGGTQVQSDGEELLVLREADVIALVEES